MCTLSTLSRHPLTLALACVAAVGPGCGADAPPLERSCRGEAVPNCRAYEYAVVTSASLGPGEVQVGDPGARVHVVIEMQTCGERAPAPHTVAIRALATASGGVGDAGASERIFDLAEVHDDGMSFGDATALDGLIDVMVPNPFIGGVPPSSNVILRFTPQLRTCEGVRFEVPYRTGPPWMPGR